MRFRIFIIKDPDADKRGFSLAGIKVPLTSLCPEQSKPSLLDLDGKSAFLNPYTEYWNIPTRFLVAARPALAPALRGVDELLIPVDWCDVAPIDSFEDMGAHD